jgi:hypothetical protein
VLAVDRSGIAEVGRVEHDAVTPTQEQWCGKPEPMPVEEDGGASSSPAYPGCEPMPQPDMIQRSLVVDGNLWTLGQWTLQANALADLARGAVVPVD